MLRRASFAPAPALALAAAILTVSCDGDGAGVDNVPPTPTSPTVEAFKNEATTVDLAASDPDGDALTYRLARPPSNGTVTLQPSGADRAVATYTPNSDFTGTDSFDYAVSDGEDEVTGTVTIEVVDRAPVLDAPEAVFRPLSDPDGSVVVVLSATDPDGDPVTFEVVDGPDDGTLSDFEPVAGAEPRTTVVEATYTPDDASVGDDAFTVVATDGTNTTEPATVLLPLNEPPVADDVEVTTPQGQPVTITLTGSDDDGHALTFEIVEGPDEGTLSTVTSTGAGSAEVTYTPDEGFSGTDAFTYRADDGLDPSEAATVTVAISAPSVTPVTVETHQATPVTVALEGSDPEDDPLTFSVVEGPTNGTVSEVTSTGDASAEVTYTPAAGFTGTDAFSVVATDGTTESPPATVTVQVTNQAPVVEDAEATAPKRGTVVITLTGTDPDGDPLTFSVGDADHGSLSEVTSTGPTSAEVTYDPAGAYEGEDAFTFTASDGAAASEAATVTVSVEVFPVAYVANYDDDDVSVIDVRAGTVTGTIEVGNGPASVAFTPDELTAFVGNWFSHTVSVIDVEDGTVSGTISIAAQPIAIAVTPDGTKAYVASLGSDEVVVIDVATATVSTSIPVGDEPFALAITPDGTEVYVANSASDDVSVIDVATNIVTGTIPVGSTPSGVAVTPDGSEVWVVNVDSDEISVIDVGTGTVDETFGTRDGPMSLAFTPDGETVYVVNRDDDDVSEIDVGDRDLVDIIGVGDEPFQITITGDGATAYVVNRLDDTVSVIDLETEDVTEIDVGEEPVAVGITR